MERIPTTVPTRSCLILALAVMTVLVASDPAQAARVTHVFSGVGFGGAPFLGTLTYQTDTLVLGLHVPPYDPAVGLDVVIGDVVFESNDDFPFSVTPTTDPDGSVFLSAAGAGYPFSNFFWRVTFIDSSGTALSGSRLPTSLSLDDLDGAFFSHPVQLGNQRVIVAFEIDSLQTVPEPGTAALLAAGLLMLGRRSRRGVCRDVA